MSIAEEILQKWLEFSNYDLVQTHFHLFSSEWKMHEATKRMERICQFDPSCTVAALYAKAVFLDICKDTNISVFELFETPEIVDEARDMWTLFHSRELQEIEDALVDRIDGLVRQIVPTAQIGTRDMNAERGVLLNSIATVTEELIRCRTDVFSAGGPIGDITRFDTSIRVFPRLSDCVLTLEKAEDGLYVCFIRNEDTADAFFGFFVKSGGTLVAVDERIPEQYPGEHNNARNARHSDEKQYNLFPYDKLVSYGDYDYTGHSTTHEIDTTDLAIFDLGADAYMPLLFSMVLLAGKLKGFSPKPSECLMFDTILPVNLADVPSEALVRLSESAIAQTHKEWHTTLTSEDVRSGALRARFKMSEPKDLELSAGSFATVDGLQKALSEQEKLKNSCDLFVSLYGDGFQPNLDAALLRVVPELPGAAAVGSNPMVAKPQLEYVGTAEEMEKNIYTEGRRQLAEYIRDRMFEELRAFGGREAVNKWFEQAILDSRERLIRLCMETEKQEPYVTARDGKSFFGKKTKLCDMEQFRTADKAKDCLRGVMSPFNEHPIQKNTRAYPDYSVRLCPNTGAKATIFFHFTPSDWLELQELLGPLPKILLGWDSYGHQTAGNSLLYCTDAVTGVGTPFEYYEQTRNTRYVSGNHWSPPEDGTHALCPRTKFDFCIAFSKRGWAMEKAKYA